MKAIINGKRYDTQTATEIDHYSNQYSRNDFKYYEEGLYKTKAGNWFLKGTGGPMTKYARPAGNMTTGGPAIIPLSATEAREWLEHTKNLAALEEHFGAEMQDA